MLAGVLVGLSVERAAQDDVDSDLADPDDRLLPLALEAAAVGPLCGLLWLLLSVASGGAVGGDRLAEVGPASLPVALALSALVGLPAALTAFTARVRGQRVISPSNST